MASIRGPLLPIIRRGGAGGAGISTASWACTCLPSSVTRSPASSRRMIVKDSSKRDTRWS